MTEARKAADSDAPTRIRELEKSIDGVIRQVEDADAGIGSSPEWHEAWGNLKAVRRGELAVAPAVPGNESQIEYMVSRFLRWKLPEDFQPDAGISVKPMSNDHTAHPMKHEPSGTNLFDAKQAAAMVRYMIDGMPTDSVQEARIILMAHGYAVTPPQGKGRLVPHHGSGPGDPSTASGRGR